MGLPSQTNGVNLGALKPQTTSGRYNETLFVVQQALSKLQTATLVKVLSCSNNGGLSPVGTVEIQPLINQIDGVGNPTPHVTIYNVPYFRLQGGANAVILDPRPGDIGIAIFASRDITKVKSTKKQANPGSYRQFDFSDALYIGGLLNGTPEQYVQFASEGVSIVSPNAITLQAPQINLKGTLLQTDGDATITENLKVEKDVTVTGDATAKGTSLHTHRHPDAQGGTTGQPI